MSNRLKRGVALLALLSCTPAHRGTVTIPSRAIGPLRLPPLHDEKLPNGLDVMLVESHSLPIVSMTLQFPAGSEAEPDGREGIALMAVALLREGTATRSAEQIAEAIDYTGGDLGSDADDDSMSLTVKVLRRDFATALGILSEEVLSPTFPADEIESARRQLTATVRQKLDDPDTLATEHANALAYGADEPYGRSASEASVRSITREDLLSFREHWLVPDGSTLIIAGDVGEDLMPAVREAFAGWKHASVPVVPLTRRPQKRAVRLVDKPDLTQSFLALALPGLSRHDPDYYPARVMDAVFGDGFGSRLTRVVRTQFGKTYDVSARFIIHPRRGILLLTTSTRNAETAATLALVMGEMSALQSGAKPISAEELEGAKASVMGSWPRRFETASDAGEQVLWARRLGVSLDELKDYRSRVAEVTLDEANAAARKYLDASNVVVVVCGKASEVKEPLEKLLGPVEVRDFRRAP